MSDEARQKTGLFTRLSEASSDAAAKVKGFPGDAAAKIKELSDDVAAAMKEVIDGLAALGDGAKERMARTANRVFDLSPAFEAAGYRLNRVVIGVSVPPSIEVYVTRYKRLSARELAAVRDEYRDRKLFLRLLDGLAIAHSIQDGVSTEDFVVTDIVIELSVPPKISLRYHNSEVANLIGGSPRQLLEE